MSNKRDFFMDAFSNLLWFALFYGIFLVPAAMIYQLRMHAMLPVSLVIMLIFFLARRFIRPVVPMFLVHLAVPVAAFFLAPVVIAQVVYIAVAVILAVFSIQQRYARADTFGPGFFIVAPVILVFIALIVGRQGHEYIYTPYVALIILTGVGSRFHARSTHVNDSLTIITQTSTQPVKKILAFDYKAMAVFCVVIVGLILFLNVFLIRPALEVLSVIRLRLPFGGTPSETYTDIWQDMPDMFGGVDLGFLEPTEPWFVWQILERIVLALVPVVVALALGYLLFRAIRHLFGKLRAKDKIDHDHASGFEDIKEFISTPKAKRSWFFGSRNEHKLRRLFRETVTRHMKKGVPIKKSDTPVEMAEKIKAEDISSLVDQYAAVRYGEV